MSWRNLHANKHLQHAYLDPYEDLDIQDISVLAFGSHEPRLYGPFETAIIGFDLPFNTDGTLMESAIRNY